LPTYATDDLLCVDGGTYAVSHINSDAETIARPCPPSAVPSRSRGHTAHSNPARSSNGPEFPQTGSGQTEPPVRVSLAAGPLPEQNPGQPVHAGHGGHAERAENS